MTKKLIIYSTTDGHTKHICDYIADRSKKKSLIELIPIEDVKNIDLSLYETIIIGASIRYGKHQPELYEFIKRNLEILKTVKYWPPVARVDNVYGDKNLFCTCPSMDEYEDSAA